MCTLTAPDSVKRHRSDRLQSNSRPRSYFVCLYTNEVNVRFSSAGYVIAADCGPDFVDGRETS